MEQRERLQGKEDKIKFIDFDLKADKFQVSGKEEGKVFHKLQVLRKSDDLCGRICGVGSKTLKWFEWVELLVVLTPLTGTEIISLIFSEQCP